jgi:hypothetical protein
VAVSAANCPNGEAADGVAAAAGTELASPGNVKAATARHTPTVAYNFECKMNSPEHVMRSQAQRHPRARIQGFLHADREYRKKINETIW